MKPSKTPTRPTPLPSRSRVLGAAERLLRSGNGEFSMRDLAAEAGVSFATPFNQFGSKVAIMRALSARRIATMRERLGAAALPASATERVLVAVAIAADVMLAEPEVSRAVMGVLGAPNDAPGDTAAQSADLWNVALGTGDGFRASERSLAMTVLPGLLAVAFRGVLSFWTAGEFEDDRLLKHAQAAAAGVLMGFVAVDGRAELQQYLLAANE